MRTLLFVIFSIAVNAQSLRNAEAAFLSASTADVLSSRGLIERNPLLGSGPFGTKQAVTSLAISAGVTILADRIAHRHPKMRKPLAVVLWGMAGVRAAVTIHNQRIK